MDWTLPTMVFADSATPVLLMSPWKPVLVFLTFLPWAWLVSSKLDKDARYFRLNPQMWNSIHMTAGIVAAGVMFLLVSFWVAWPVGILVLLVPILVYWQIRNNAVDEVDRYVPSMAKISSSVEARRAAKARDAAVLQITDSSGDARAAVLNDDPLFPVHLLMEDLLVPAMDERASYLELAIGSAGCNTARTIDGVAYKQPALETEMAAKVIAYIKEAAGLNIEDHRRRQLGAFKVSGPTGSTNVRVVTSGSSKGTTLRLDFDLAKRLRRPIEQLGLTAAQLESVRTLEPPHERHGIVLISSTHNQGLSTTGYSLLASHDAYTSNAKSLEMEVLATIEGADQMEWDATNPDVDFATNLQSILRRDPDILLLTDLPDGDTARSAVAPGANGPLQYILIGAPSIAETIRKWVKYVGDVEAATKPLKMVIHQRLARALCPNCKQAYQPTEQAGINLPLDKIKELYRPGGKVQVRNKIETCPVCNGLGYLGQLGVFEVMVIDREARKLLRGGDLKAALAHCRRNKMLYLQEAGLQKVLAGETSLEEIGRITTAAKKKPASTRSKEKSQA
jgi:general secretion pathway protein E